MQSYEFLINFAESIGHKPNGTELTIKQIAEKNGVSVGTVVRILHNRGSVSEETMKAVQEVLYTCKYRKNIHKSAIAFTKTGKTISL